MLEAWQKFCTDLFENPQHLQEIQKAYWEEVMQCWQNPPNSKDKRFQNENWEQSHFFHMLKELYLLNTKHVKNLLSFTPQLDKKAARKVRFMLEQWTNALAPTNFVLTNPEILQQTLATQGENLTQGFKNFWQDVQRNKKHFAIQMTDPNAFTLGENIAITPGKVVYQNDLMQLLHYCPTREKVHGVPLLIIPPWINKYYILDLQQHNSLVKWLVDQGYDVFMISWVNPDERHATKEFSNYLEEGLLTAITEVLQLTSATEVNAVGYCIGGTLLAIALAYLAEKKMPLIKSATFFAALIDFSDPGDLEVFIDEEQLQALQKMMAETGYLDGGYMSATFNLLRSNDLIWSYYVNNYLRGQQPAPFDILYWNADPTNMPAKLHSEYLREMYLFNRLIQPQGMTIGDVALDLSKITVPTYCLATQQDHIAPWHSVFKGIQSFNSKIRFVLTEAGHIAGVVNPPQQNRYGYYSNDEISSEPEQWLAGANKVLDSWWNDWNAWLEHQSGEWVSARHPQPALEDAPGSYVKVRLEQ